MTVFYNYSGLSIEYCYIFTKINWKFDKTNLHSIKVSPVTVDFYLHPTNIYLYFRIYI